MWRDTFIISVLYCFSLEQGRISENIKLYCKLMDFRKPLKIRTLVDRPNFLLYIPNYSPLRNPDPTRFEFRKLIPVPMSVFDLEHPKIPHGK